MPKKNVVSIEDRIPKLKQARKKKANRRLIYYLCAFFLLISLIIYLQSPLSRAKQLIVKGNEYLTDEEVINISGLTHRTNIWTVDKKKVAETLQKSSLIKSASIQRKLPRGIEIKIEENMVVAYILKDRHYKPILDNGNILPVDDKMMNGNIPLLHDFSNEKQLERMTAELKELNSSIRNLISEIYWEPTKGDQDKITLYMKQGYMVKGTIRDFAKKMEIYPSIVSQLDPKAEGIIHIGVGAYFEQTNEPTKNKENE